MTTQSPGSIVLRIGEREYELVPFLMEGETSIAREEIVRRVVECNIDPGEEDAKFIVTHHAEIPDELKRITMIFLNYFNPLRTLGSSTLFVPSVYYNVGRWEDNSWREDPANEPFAVRFVPRAGGARWILGWVNLTGHLPSDIRLVRRRPPVSEAGK